MLQIHTNKGVTLVESLVAVALVGISLVVMLATFTVGRTISAGMVPRVRVINRLREKIEVIKTLDEQGPIVDTVYNNEIIDDKGNTDPADDIVSTLFRSEIVQNENLCRRVTVEMQWTETRSGTQVAMQETLVTYMANH